MQQQNDLEPGFTPKFRQIHPQATLWIKNPLSYDIEFQVADEINRKFLYKLPAGRVSELPGGSVATLGLKRLVDEILSTGRDAEGKETTLKVLDPLSRAAVEKDVIVKERRAPQVAQAETPGGPINLGVKTSDIPEDDDGTADEPAEPADLDDEEFATLEQSDSTVVGGDPLPLEEAEKRADSAVKSTADQSLAHLPANVEIDG